MKFSGDVASLKELVSACRVRGEWRLIEKSGLLQFKAATGENLGAVTGTITFQGGDKAILAKRFAVRSHRGIQIGNGKLSLLGSGRDGGGAVMRRIIPRPEQNSINTNQLNNAVAP